MCRVKSRSIYFTNMMCKRLLSVLVLSIVSKYSFIFNESVLPISTYFICWSCYLVRFRFCVTLVRGSTCCGFLDLVILEGSNWSSVFIDALYINIFSAS